MKYLWMDLETTGLDPQKDKILEVAWLITDTKLNVIKEVTSMLCPPSNFEDMISTLDPYVLDMHTRNNLIDNISSSTPQPLVSEVVVKIISDAYSSGLPYDNIVLAGSSPHFDRGFIKQNMQELDSILHHRHFDVSTLKMHGDAAGIPRLTEQLFEPHRAYSDIVDSLEVARYYLDRLKKQEGRA